MGKQIEAPHQKIKSCSETKKGEISKKGNKDDWQMQDLIFWCEAKLLLKKPQAGTHSRSPGQWKPRIGTHPKLNYYQGQTSMNETRAQVITKQGCAMPKAVAANG